MPKKLQRVSHTSSVDHQKLERVNAAQSDNAGQKKAVREFITKPAVFAVTSAVLLPWISNAKKINSSLLGMDIPLWLLGAVMGYFSETISDTATGYIIPRIYRDKRVEKYQMLWTSAVISGSTFAATGKVLNMSSFNSSDAAKFFGTGLLADAISDYAVKMISY